jgi:predicted nucleotidyltransferase
MIDLTYWKTYVDSLAYNPLFVTVSGAHLYGFESPDSDVDLRGCHLLPLSDVVGLALPNETFEKEEIYEGTEIDVVSHDVGKYLRLLVKNNGYILEQVFSPLVVTGQDFLDELRPIASRCITRHHYHHYRGFYGTQRKLIEKQPAKTAKAVLYAYRVLLTGIHLLRTGEVEANILRLNEDFKLSVIGKLIAMKTEEKVAPPDLDWPAHAVRLDELEATLDRAFEESTLPEDRDRNSANQLLVRLRLGKDA